MKIHRFFLSMAIPKNGTFVVSDKNLLNQWRKVLRMEVGDRIVAFDGRGDEVLCEIQSLDKKSATLLILEKKKGLVPTREVTLFMALIKRDHFELVLEKATELGVSRIVPLACARSEKKGINRERCEKILREASEQSGRATVPVLDEPISIREIPTEGTIALDPRGSPVHIGLPYVNPMGIVIGPEGGFTDEEIEFLKKEGAQVVSVGQTILRAETAAIVALALVLV